jgi:hypothetical protein
MTIHVTEYHISKNESIRRKKAFIALIVSFMIGLVISSFDYGISHFITSIFIFLALSGLLFGSVILNNRWQDRFSRKRILVDDQTISTISEKTKTTYYIGDIQKIFVKRTFGGYIRQIKLSFISGRSTIFNGLAADDFNSLEKSLISRCNPETVVKEIKEPIDFDHRLFYPILGLIISSMFTLFMRLITGMNPASLKIVYLCIVIYILIVGLIIFLLKPFYNLHGPKGIKSDYIFGSVFLILGILIYFYLFCFLL